MNPRFESWLRHHRLMAMWQRATTAGDAAMCAALVRFFNWHSPVA